MWQEILTGAIVAVAAIALLWRFLPQRWRARAASVHPALGPTAKPGCGGCNACGGERCAPTRKP
ncbi:hypothetical protein [Acidovorax sp. MR-S7]|uniref:hypothetical protein n=1 Tax=Acidovorax sp. MR-S7 TaxID=1268622 RepID=UPI000369F1EB|nr:hypothetical protein [Acidovorax sp. MR-S7]GAD20863.1 hypothetical protein AVS7_00624 [Acidovorax sp. MR-S7]